MGRQLIARDIFAGFRATQAIARLQVFPRLFVQLHGRLLPHGLFAAYMSAFAAVVLTNDIHLPGKLMKWLVLPLFLLSVIIPPKTTAKRLYVTTVCRWLARSTILRATAAYLLFLLLATAMRDDAAPDVIAKSFSANLRQTVDVATFVLVTAYITATYPQFFRRFFLVAAGMLTVNGIVNLIAYVRAPNFNLSERLVGVFGTPQFVNSTHIAPLFVTYGLATLGLAASTELTKQEKIFVAATVFILFGSVLLTQSRGAIVALFGGLLLLAFVGSRVWRVIAVVVVALATLSIFASPLLRDHLISRGGSFRTELWEAYSSLARLKHPWLGFGLGQELWVRINGYAFEQPHNTLVWAYLRGGIGGALACGYMMFSALYWTFRSWRHFGNAAPAFAVLALLVTAVTEIGFLPWWFGWLWIMFWLPIGMAAGAELQFTRPPSSAISDDRVDKPEASFRPLQEPLQGSDKDRMQGSNRR